MSEPLGPSAFQNERALSVLSPGHVQPWWGQALSGWSHQKDLISLAPVASLAPAGETFLTMIDTWGYVSCHFRPE